MITVPAYKGSIALYGLGISGMASLRALIAGGTKVVAWDDNPECRAEAENLGAKINDMTTLTSDIEAVLLAPGIPLTHPEPHPLVVKAKESGIPIIGDMTLFARALDAYAEQGLQAPIIAITGTNGKSTTTALTAHLLKDCGFDVQMGGNIGMPVMSFAAPADNTVYVVELSSYQIDLTPEFEADVAILLNITPDHIDRHGSFANYRQSKWKIFENMTAADIAIIGVDCETSRDCADQFGHTISAHLYRVSGNDEQTAEIYVSGNVLKDEQGDVVNLSSIQTLQGQHNHQNAAAAYTAARVVGAQREKLADSFARFPGLAHRMQPVAQYQNMRFINDSKATNAEAASKALAAYENIYWIAGGVSKAGGIAALLPYLTNVRKAYLIGEAAEEFAQALLPHVPISINKTLERAVTHATRDASEEGGGVVLLSPACASFDQFQNFEHRGDVFCHAVNDFIDKNQLGGAA